MNRDDLQTRVEAYLHRTDLTAQVPGFIELATARIGRDLRSTWNTVYEVLTVNADPFPLPEAVKAVKSLAFNASRGPRDLSAVGIATLNKYANGGEPYVYAIRGRAISIRPYLAADYEIEYFAEPAALDTGTSENDVLTHFPYLYLYATLYEAYIYLQDEELAAAMALIYRGEMDSVNAQEQRLATGDAPAMRAI